RHSRPARVHGEHHPPGSHHVEGLHEDLAPGRPDLGGRVVGRVHGDVGVPHGRRPGGGHLRRLGRDRGDVMAADLGQGVHGPLPHGLVVVGPAEYPRVESFGGVLVSGWQVHPAWRPLRVRRAFWHAIPLFSHRAPCCGPAGYAARPVKAIKRFMTWASGSTGTSSAKLLPPPRASGVMILCATWSTCSASASDTTTCWSVARAKSHAWTRNSMLRIPRAVPAGIAWGPRLMMPSRPRACHASSVGWATSATLASSVAAGASGNCAPAS